jgi:L-seryl-tRNA(Ser) seleniumtransferase
LGELLVNKKAEDSKQKLLRQIPSVEKILAEDEIVPLCKKYSRPVVLKAIQTRLGLIRNTIVGINGPVNDFAHLIKPTSKDIEHEIRILTSPSLKKVINATGVILHTNLGRSILSPQLINHLTTVATSYSNLEYDVGGGKRGSRYSHVEKLLCDITGAEAALVVNNNAAAVFLALNTLAQGRETIVSRGELIEIGGSFRIPDILKRSGSEMVEVGTTNKTHLRDYESAVTGKTAVLLKVHTSNYRIVGFTTEVELPDLVKLGKQHNIPVVNDLGSGSLIDFAPYGLTQEPTVQEVVKTGVDVITFSGDKLLGGPQAGVIVGRRSILEPLVKNPLNRALRIDKLTLAALELTLRLYLDQESVIQKVPTLKMITMTQSELSARSSRFKEDLSKHLSDTITIQVEDDISQVGGGALPEQKLPTKVIALHSKTVHVQECERKLRDHNPPVIARIHKDQLRIDLRTVAEEDEQELLGALCTAFKNATL